MGFLAANWVAILLGLGLVAAAAYIVKTKTDGATDPAADAKAKLLDVGSLVKDKINAVVADVTGAVEDIDSTALFFSTLALRKHYLKHVPADDVDAVNVAFQSLQNINAKLPTTKTPA